MPRQILVVHSNPTAGKEEEYNEWYDNVHVRDVCRSPGFVSARRFKIVTGESKHKYLTIYEMDCEDPIRAFKEMAERAGTDEMIISDSLDAANADHALFEQISSYKI